jgi:hypothetical protein
MRGIVSSTLRSLYPGKSFVQELWWAPTSVCTGVENLPPSPTEIRTRNGPACSESLRRLSYRSRISNTVHCLMCAGRNENSSSIRLPDSLIIYVFTLLSQLDSSPEETSALYVALYWQSVGNRDPGRSRRRWK